MLMAGAGSVFVALLLHLSVALGETNICALKGSEVELSCSITDPSSKKWFTAHWNGKKYDNLQEVSVDTNRLMYNGSKQSSSSLRIHDLRESDSNTYLCRDNKGQSESLSLSVTDLQVFRARPNEGQVMLKCNHSCIPTYFTNPTYSWYENQFKQATSSQYIDVTVPSAESYSCSLKDHDYPRSAAVCAVDNCWSVNYIKRKICALEGTSVEMSSNYSYPSGYVVTDTFWHTELRSGERNPTNMFSNPKYDGRIEYNDNVNENQHKLIIKNVTKYDSANYVFRLITDKREGKLSGIPGVILDITALTVTVTPATTVTEGQRVTLSCTTSCPLSDFNPIYIWYQNHLFLNQNQHNYVTLDPVLSQHAGNYSCAVKDQETLRSPEKTLNVRYRPKTPLVSVSPSGEIEEGSSVSLTCSSDANPPVNIYIWYKKSSTSPMTLEQNYFITNISLEDGGEYYCTATNELGTSNSTIQLTVTRKTMAANVVGVVINAFRLFLVLLLSLLLLIYMGISMKKCLMSVTEPRDPVQPAQSVSDPEYENDSATPVSPSSAEQTQTTKPHDDVHCASVHFSHANDQGGPTAFIQM